MFSHISFDCVLLLLLLLLPKSLEEVYTVEVGQDAILPCHYSPTSSVKNVPVCWGHSFCPVSHCHETVLTTDGSHVNQRVSSRYKLKGSIQKGDVSLTIEKVTSADSGTYCCRVEFPGLFNDKKVDLELVIIPAKVTTAWTLRKNLTTIFPQMFTTKGHSSAETWTWETFHNGNQTKNSTLANEIKDYMTSTRIAVYTAAGISAGLAMFFIIAALILKWYSYKKDTVPNSSLISMANTPPSGFANAARMHSEENIYIIEENIYELEDSNQYYCSIREEQQP
ncbi:PREDICTED: hepatitis A virus cellular receptor 2 [Elephantulus edwardii]|uniref:hepatitis A virus cellular receptor 2 n=1 Tax=Elephantulus edwardii TaxID=28737 RepID=UPI0003F084B1|nr:PREDICTED: hepatitis A virus cellular receptor 2 [Elephantulus edwardii]